MGKNINIKVIDREGVEYNIETQVDPDMNLMELCREEDLPVIGLCGGMLICATCQVYVHTDNTLPEKGEEEDAMLSEANNVKDNSRLSCQLNITEDLDGLVVELAPE